MADPEITAESILSTAKRLNIRLSRVSYVTASGEGCAAGVACLVADGATEARPISQQDAERLLPFHVRVGLGRGFEIPNWQNAKDREMAKYQEIGRSVRKMVGEAS